VTRVDLVCSMGMIMGAWASSVRGVGPTMVTVCVVAGAVARWLTRCAFDAWAERRR